MPFCHLQYSSATYPPSSLNIMHPHDVLHPTPLRDLKRTITDLESDSEPASKRTRPPPDQLPTPPYSIQDGHPEQFSHLCDTSDWRERLRLSLLRPLDNRYPPTTKQVTVNPQLRAWLDAVPYPRAISCPASSRIRSPPSCPFRSDNVQLKRPQSCEARFDLIRHKWPASGSDPKPKRARLTLTALQNMSQQEP